MKFEAYFRRVVMIESITLHTISMGYTGLFELNYLVTKYLSVETIQTPVMQSSISTREYMI